jgi:two-component system, LytTR family, response regulator
VRAIVVDDEPIARRRLRTLLQRETGLEIVAECEDGTTAIEAIHRLQPDVVFLDVQMPGLDGFDVVEAIQPSGHSAIVFVTAYDRYAVRAFEVHAVDYLLKPFEPERLRKTLARVAGLGDRRDASRRLQAAVESVLAHRPLRRVVVKAPGRVYAVGVDEIESIHAAGHYLELRTAAAAHLIRESMNTLEARLDPARFARIHRSTIVNVDRIRELQPAFHGEFVVIMQNGRRLRCTRTFAETLTKAIGG